MSKLQNKDIAARIKQVLSNRRFGVFSTVWRNQSHQTLVCFTVSDDLQYILFGTPKESRKYINSRIFDKISFFVDSTQNDPKDLTQAVTIAAVGKIYPSENLSKSQLKNFLTKYKTKHPYLDQFIDSPSTQLVVVEVEDYQFVENFQTVVEWNPREDIETSKFRQIQGKKEIQGEARGKLLKYTPNLEFEKIGVRDILWISEDQQDLHDLKPVDFGAIIGNEFQLSKDIRTHCQTKNIPVVHSLGDLSSYIHENDEVSVDGYLGLIVLHEVR